MQKGGRAADVWILSSAPVEQITLLPADDDGLDAKLATVLPSRAADNLFWLGRYIERADGLARVLRAYHGRIAEDPQARNPVLPAIRLALKGIGNWTADIYLLSALRRPDIWPTGDLALAIAVQEVKRLRTRPSPEKLEKMSAPWRPYRAVAARLFWHAYLSKRGQNTATISL